MWRKSLSNEDFVEVRRRSRNGHWSTKIEDEAQDCPWQPEVSSCDVYSDISFVAWQINVTRCFPYDIVGLAAEASGATKEDCQNNYASMGFWQIRYHSHRQSSRALLRK